MNYPAAYAGDQVSEPIRGEVSRRIEWSDTDASGHHHNSVIWRLVEAAEADLMRRAGVVDAYFAAAPRVHQEVDYTAKLYFGQPVTATLTLEHVGTSSMRFTFEVWGDEFADHPRRMAAKGQLVAVHVAPGQEHSSPWPDEIRAALSGCQRSSSR